MRPQAQWYLDDAYSYQLPDSRWVYRFFRVDGEITHTYSCYAEINSGPDEDTETFCWAPWNPEVLPDSVIPVSERSPFAHQLQLLEEHNYPILASFAVHNIEEGKK